MPSSNITTANVSGILDYTTNQTIQNGVAATVTDETLNLRANLNTTGTGSVTFTNCAIRLSNISDILRYGNGGSDASGSVALIDSYVQLNIGSSSRCNIAVTRIEGTHLRSTNTGAQAFLYTQAGNKAVLDSRNGKNSVIDGFFVHEISGAPLIYRNTVYKNNGLNILNWSSGSLPIRGVSFGSGNTVNDSYTGADGVTYTTYDAWLGAGNSSNRFHFFDCVINLSKIAIQTSNTVSGAELCFKYFSRTERFFSGVTPIDGMRLRYTPTASFGVSPQADLSSVTALTGNTSPATIDFCVQSTVNNGSTKNSSVGAIANYSLKNITWQRVARAYAYQTLSENITPSSKVGDIGNESLVFTLPIPFLTLTETQALALTGIVFAANGPNGGTITITQPRSAAEIWQAYRAWISQFVNFGSSDSWQYDGTLLNLGAWDVVNNSTITGTISTTGSYSGTGSVNGLYTSSAGTSAQLTLTGLPLGSQVLVTDGTGSVIEYVSNSGISYTLRIAPGASGSWTYRVARYGSQTVSASFTPSVGGNFGGAITLLPDTFVVATQAATSALTDLTSTQQIYDRIALFGTTQAGMIAGNLASKGFGTLTVPAGLTLDPAASSLISIVAGVVIAKCSALVEDTTIISSGSFNQGSSILGNAVKIRASNLDSELIYVANALTLYATAANRDSGSNPGPTSTNGILRFKAGWTLAGGVSMTGPTFARADVGVILMTNFTLTAGVNLLDLGTGGQLAKIIANQDVAKTAIDSKPTLAQIEASATLAKESTVSSRSSQVSVNAIAQVVADKTGYALTTAERLAIATAVEQSILNESDGQAILNAIVGAIGNTNISQVALVAAIRSDIERTGGKLDIQATSATLKSWLDTINAGVKKSSLIIPHTQNLT